MSEHGGGEGEDHVRDGSPFQRKPRSGVLVCQLQSTLIEKSDEHTAQTTTEGELEGKKTMKRTITLWV
jgi:hypothetical protein